MYWTWCQYHDIMFLKHTMHMCKISIIAAGGITWNGQLKQSVCI